MSVVVLYNEFINETLTFYRSNGLVVKSLDSQSRGLMFKTAGCLQGQLSLSSLQD